MQDSFQLTDVFEDRGVSQEPKTGVAENCGPTSLSLDAVNVLTSIQALKTYGYPELEAKFLHMVALHSGVFLARHFNHYASIKSGKRIDSLVNKLKSNHHCQTYRLSKNATVFHLTSRCLYRAMGHENLRHRRSHKVDYIKTKLLSLDYVLENPSFKYFPTEEEKIQLFTQEFQIPRSDLPTKAYKTTHSKTETSRYFVDKFPLYLSALSVTPPVVHFTYVDPGPYTGIPDFLNYLRMYSKLFTQMEVSRLVYIYNNFRKWKQAEDLFHSFVRAGCKVKADDLELAKYFQIRLAWELEQYEKVGAKEILLLNQGKKKYAGSRYEGLYVRWKSGDRTFSADLSEEGRVPAGAFTAYEIRNNYSVFGDLD